MAERKAFQLTGAILSLAITLGASDIPWARRIDGDVNLAMRLRIDSVLQEVRVMPGSAAQAVTARLKNDG